jgi:hypothetical protein
VRPAAAARERSSRQNCPVFEEADECVDWLTFLRDARIRHEPALLQEAEELARIFAKAVRSARGKSE